MFSILFSSPDDERDLTSPSHTSSSKDVSSSAVLRSLQVNVGPDGEETRVQSVQKPPELLSSPETSSLLQDLQPSDSTSFILLNLTRAGNSPVYHLAGYVSDNRMQEMHSTSLSLPLTKGKRHKIFWTLLDIPAVFNYQQLPTVQRVKMFLLQQLHLCNEC